MRKRKAAMTSIPQRLLPVICLACLASAARAEDRTSAIRDEAGLFRADTIDQAERQIDDIHRTYDRNVFVDTVKSVPPHERKWFRFLWTRQVNRLLEEQARKRARESGADGIYIVICNDPKDVHVVVQPADDPAFTRHNAEELRRALARRLHDSGPDPALLAAVRQVDAALQAHRTRGQSTSVVNEFVLAGLLGGGLALWVVLGIIRFKMGAGRAINESAAERACERPALLGAMFGSPTGQWLYDKLYPCPARAPELVSEPEASVMMAGDGVEKAEADGPRVDEHPEDVPMVP
jgi:hypothetical protein